MKKVLVSACVYRDNPMIPIYGVRNSYLKKMIKYDLLPVFITPMMTRQMIGEIYNMCDAVYFLGGGDWDPIHYKHPKHPETLVDEPERDAIEIPLLQQTLADKKPYLGICRGCQGLAIASGGSIIQHLPDIFPGEDHSPHKNYDGLLTGPKHPVIIDRKSQAHKILKQDQIMVNTYHHQAVDKPGFGMKIVGRSPAGVAEIIESVDPDYFCIGVNSHPEAEEESFFEDLFKAFARHIQNREVKPANQKVENATFYLDS